VFRQARVTDHQKNEFQKPKNNKQKSEKQKHSFILIPAQVIFTGNQVRLSAGFLPSSLRWRNFPS